MTILSLIGRHNNLFQSDIFSLEQEIATKVRNSRLLKTGARSISKADTREIFKPSPTMLHLIHKPEKNMVDPVLDLRCTIGFSAREFKTLIVDMLNLPIKKQVNIKIRRCEYGSFS